MSSKKVLIDYRAKKELLSFPRDIQVRIKGLLTLLGELGFLKSPTVKKLSFNLHEIRLRKSASYRVLFSYIKNVIIVVSAFKKKTNKTPLNQLQKALNRALEYRNE